MENREELPRVSVESLQDWQKVRSNYKGAAMASIRAQIASKEPSREQDAIMAHFEQFVERSLAMAQPNLRVNGHNFESLDESGREMEPFDEALDRRIWSLADTRLQWHKRIAETRRMIPTEIEASVSLLFEQHRELDTTVLSVPSEDTYEETLIEEEDPEQQHRIEDTFQKTSALVNELNQTISQQKERGKRIAVIAAEVSSLKP